MRKPERIYAIAGALLFHLVVLVVFVSTFLTYPLQEWRSGRRKSLMILCLRKWRTSMLRVSL